MKDALDTIKYTLRKFLLDDENREEPLVIQPQECSWKKVLSSSTYPAFRQQIGEKLLHLTKAVSGREINTHTHTHTLTVEKRRSIRWGHIACCGSRLEYRRSFFKSVENNYSSASSRRTTKDFRLLISLTMAGSEIVIVRTSVTVRWQDRGEWLVHSGIFSSIYWVSVPRLRRRARRCI